MQYDRQPDGTLVPLPKPSVDTGAGLERISAITQGVTIIYHTDLFAPLIAAVEKVVGIDYWGRESDERRTGSRRASGATVANAVDPASFRVLADHARAVAFLLADGVFPSNEGRGYVLRRILRRAVRHAWLLGRKEPTLVYVVQAVIDTMGDAYPELRARAQHIVNTTRVEEQGFLDTIEGGLARFEQLAPAHDRRRRPRHPRHDQRRRRVPALRHVRLSDRSHGADGARARLRRRHRRASRPRSTRSANARRTSASRRKLGVHVGRHRRASTVGDVVGRERRIVVVRRLRHGRDRDAGDRGSHLADGRVAMMLRESPFYAESGGQISDHGEIIGEGWRVDVDDVKKIDGRPAAIGTLSGAFHFGRVTARVPSDRRRDTERNHTATHLLHAALRQVLGEGVHQAGSLVTPDRLRFDFTHHGPVNAERVARDRGDREPRDLARRAGHDPRDGVSRRRAPPARWRCSARSTATSCAS